MARLDCTGAEAPVGVNELDSVTVGSGTFGTSTTQVRGGLKSWKAHRPSVGVGEKDFGQLTINGSPVGIAVRFSIYVPSTVPSGGSIDVLYANLTTGFVAVNVQSSGGNLVISAAVYSSPGTSGGAATVTTTLDAWHEVCIYSSQSSTAQTVTLRVDKQASQTSGSLAGTAGNYTNVQFGILTNGTTAWDVWFDDIILDSTAADIDDQRYILSSVPVSDNGTQQWSTSSGSNHSTLVADGSDASYVRQVTNAGFDLIDLYDLTNQALDSHPTTVVAAVYACFRFGGTGDLGGFLFTIVDSTGTPTTTSITASATTKTSRGFIFATRQNGSAWGIADFNGGTNGAKWKLVGNHAGTAGTQVTVRDVWINIEVWQTLNQSSTLAVSETGENDIPLVNAVGFSEAPELRHRILDAPTLSESYQPTMNPTDVLAMSEAPQTVLLLAADLFGVAEALQNILNQSDTPTLSDARDVVVLATDSQTVGEALYVSASLADALAEAVTLHGIANLGDALINVPSTEVVLILAGDTFTASEAIQRALQFADSGSVSEAAPVIAIQFSDVLTEANSTSVVMALATQVSESNVTQALVFYLAGTDPTAIFILSE